MRGVAPSKIWTCDGVEWPGWADGVRRCGRQAWRGEECRAWMLWGISEAVLGLGGLEWMEVVKGVARCV